MEKLNLNLSAPWVIYQHKVKALFERDPDITVGDIYQPDGGEGRYGRCHGGGDDGCGWLQR